jgi:hypothetical protein
MTIALSMRKVNRTWVSISSAKRFHQALNRQASRPFIAITLEGRWYVSMEGQQTHFNARAFMQYPPWSVCG